MKENNAEAELHKGHLVLFVSRRTLQQKHLEFHFWKHFIISVVYGRTSLYSSACVTHMWKWYVCVDYFRYYCTDILEYLLGVSRPAGKYFTFQNTVPTYTYTAVFEGARYYIITIKNSIINSKNAIITTKNSIINSKNAIITTKNCI